MIEKRTAVANLEFIRNTLAEVLADVPEKRNLVRFHVCESAECVKTLSAYLAQPEEPNAAAHPRAAQGDAMHE